MRNVGTGTSITASRAATTVSPLTSTAWPAVAIVWMVASRGERPWPSAARKRTTRNSA